MKKRALALIFLLFLVLSAVVWWQLSLLPVNTSDASEKTFVVGKGQGVRDIARKLKDANLIRDQVAFFFLVRRLGVEKNIQAGSFKLSPSMSSEEIATRLTKGTEDLWITIPEGWRANQILDYLSETNPAWDKAQAREEDWQGKEGYLFPETYLVPKEVSLSNLSALFTKTFDTKIDSQMRSDVDSTDYSLEEVVIIASLIEREARHDSDRPLVSSVIHNRLKEGMKLDIDATVQYALGFNDKDGWWKKSLTLADLKVDSPYNTYTNPGLPPAPIANPGLEAIKAAIYPAKTGYLYYISDKDGRNHYATTLEEHNRNVATYLD